MAECCTFSCLHYLHYEDDLSAYLFFTCATPCQARGDSKLLFLVWMYWFSTIARTDVALEISRLRSNWRWLAVVEISSFEICIVSNWYLSVSLFFYAQALFYSLEAVNLFGFMPEKYQKCFYCGDLLIGRNSLLNLPERNGALHPDQLTLHAVVRHSLKSSYRFWFVWVDS